MNVDYIIGIFLNSRVFIFSKYIYFEYWFVRDLNYRKLSRLIHLMLMQSVLNFHFHSYLINIYKLNILDVILQ